MAEFVRFRGDPSSVEHANAACGKAVVAMRRLGAFLKTREIPVDIMATLGRNSVDAASKEFPWMVPVFCYGPGASDVLPKGVPVAF